MNKYNLVGTLLVLLMLVSAIPIAFADPAYHQPPGNPTAPFPAAYDPYHQYIEVTGLPESFDGAFAYDTTSAAVIMNVYETLVYYEPLFDIGPYQPLSGPQRAAQFRPKLSTIVPSVGNGYLIQYDPADPPINPKGGLPIYAKYIFPIREGVQYHYDPTKTVTPRDVEYSFERSYVQSRTGGPTWLLYEFATGWYDFWEMPDINATHPGYVIDGIIEQMDLNSDTINDAVCLNVGYIYPQLAVLQILAQSWGTVMSEEWAVAQGDFDFASVPGGWDNWDGIAEWNDPLPSPIEHASGDADPMKDGGSGPYRVSYRTATGWSIVAWNDHDNNPETTPRYRDEDGDGDIDIVGDGYWGGWPGEAPGSTDRLPGHVNRVSWNIDVSWPSRRGKFLGGLVDGTVVPRQYRSQLQYDPGTNSPLVGGEPVRCYYPISQLACFGLFFTFDIAPTSAHLGSGFDPANPNAFGPDRIPIDFFQDVNVRKAWAVALDYDRWINDAWLNEAFQPSDPIVPGLAYDNPAQPKPKFNVTELEYYLKVAWPDPGTVGNSAHDPDLVADPGRVWDNGMGFDMVYPSGSVPYQLATSYLVGTINPLNPLFNVAATDRDWGTYILPQMVAHRIPIFNIGWLADFADPHNFVFPFFHSQGTFTQSQAFEDPFVDALIEQGILIPDLPWEDTKNSPAYTAIQDRDNSGGLSVGDWIDVGGTMPWYEVTSYTNPTTYVAKLDRQRDYYELQELYVEIQPSMCLYLDNGRAWQPAWVRGWYYNSLEPGFMWIHRWKAKTHFGDANWDGAVNAGDNTALSAHWTSPQGAGGYNERADINGGTGGTTGSLSGLWDGIGDGSVGMADKSLLSAYWDAPRGPKHP